MIPTTQALDIINSLPVGRRVQYFEQIGGREDSDTLSETTNLSTSSRAKYLWDKLKVNWKDAVKKELDIGFESWSRRQSRNKFWSIIVENYRVD